MRKVSFGSFPLTEIKKEDRKCLDKYLIKSFADNISISDAIRNLAMTKNMMYITPDALMRDFAGLKPGHRVNRSDRESNTLYEGALKRAFYILKELYVQINTSPFYKEYVYYPIYIEKIERVTSEGSSTYDAKYTDVTMNYSFIVLSNDLTKNLHIDEIRYDENASLNFLFLFVEFFSDKKLEKSIHDFDKKDHEFLIRLYQFTEKSNKEPIQMVLDLYKIIGLLYKIKNTKENSFDQSQLVGEMDKFLKGIKVGDLKRYQGLLRHQFLDMIKRGGADGKTLRDAFTDLMGSIFKSEGLSGLYGEIENVDAGRGERHQHLYNSNKYREVLNLSKELVKYNELKCTDIVADDNLEIDFKLENSERSLDIRTGEGAQKYQTFFKDYVDSIRTFMEGMVRDLITDLKIDTELNAVIQDIVDTTDNEISEVTRQMQLYTDRAKDIDAMLKAHDAVNNNPHHPDFLHAPELRALANEYNEAVDRADIMRGEIEQQRLFSTLMSKQSQNTAKFSKDIIQEVVKEVSDHLLSALTTDLTFVYDDGKRFFTNQLVAQGLLDLSKKEGKASNHDLTEHKGFSNAVVDENNSGIFPKEVKNKNGIVGPNPEYLAASVAKGLDDAFGLMAKDTVTTFREHIIPILQLKLTNHIKTNVASKVASPSGNSKTKTAIKKTWNYFTGDTKGNYKEEIITNFIDGIKNKASVNSAKFDDTENSLHDGVFKNRFVDKVMNKFLRMFQVTEVDQIIEHDKNLSQLHPLIERLLKNGDNCQFFKSFIIEHSMVEQLYRLKYITDTQKFLDGIINTPPKKYNDPMSRMKVVLHDYLGLERNPTWVTSPSNIYLSMPGELSLTNTSIMSNIPQNDLMDVCHIKPSDYWDGDKMGEATKLGNSSPQVKKLVTDIEGIKDQIHQKRIEKSQNLETFGESVEHQIRANQDGRDGQLLEEKSSGSNTRKPKPKPKPKNNNRKPKNNNNQWGIGKTNSTIDKDIQKLYKDIEKKEEQIQKAMANWKEEKYLPNMSIFDDPYRSEKQEFLSDTEKSELIGNRDKMEEKLNKLNPYDDADVREMEANQRGIDSYRDEREKEQRSHPFDFEEEKDGKVEGPQRWENISSRETENEDWVQNGERSKNNEFTDSQDKHGYDNRDRWKR